MKIAPSRFNIPLANLVSICLVLLCCSSSEHSNDGDAPFLSGVSMGVLDNPKIDEASGLAMSVTHPGMLWTHNDSGDKARIFLIDSLGRHQATVGFEGISNRDWEDIAVGPGPDATKSYVYIGEIGDNFSRYTYKYIYRIEEPVIPKGKKKLTVLQVDSIKFTLPDGARDAESLMIDPQTKDLYIFSKREKAVNLYRLAYPQSTTTVLEAERVLTGLPFTSIVAADWSPDGKEILIKNYKKVFYWHRQNNEPVTELLQSPPAILPYDREPQGETIAFDRSGKGYYTLSEKAKGRKPELMFYERISDEMSREQ
jgi:hypothetical protein